jgi:thiamine biosynthesis protein ThiS
MKIFLNGKTRKVERACNIANLLKELALENKRLAVEVNLEIIPRSQFDNYTFSKGDRVEIVQAIGGG